MRTSSVLYESLDRLQEKAELMEGVCRERDSNIYYVAVTVKLSQNNIILI